MATLEDKILGNKLHNYCSSSSEESESEENSDSELASCKTEQQAETVDIPASEANQWEGTSTNTGPKGVIKDWQRYKQLEQEKRDADEKERIALMKKLTLSVQSALDEEKAKATENDPDLAELLDDGFLLLYQKQRMQEMLRQNQHNLRFGKVIGLKTGSEFLDAIDKENKSVTIIIHIYEENVQACRCMNCCLIYLSRLYENVKFCSILSSAAGLSRNFNVNGVPALLVYKNGQLVGNFIRLSDDLGEDFCYEDVQGFLVEHGMLEDKTCTPLIIREEDDSDNSL